MPLDPQLKQQLTDYANQYSQSRFSGYQSGKNAGFLSDAYENLRLSQQAPQRLQEVLGSAEKYGFGIEQAQTLKDYISGTDIGSQAYSELTRSKQAMLDAQQQLTDFRNKYETQAFGAPGATLEQALASKTGDLGQLNQFLGTQEANTFNTQLKPLIQMSLGAQGLSDSGAQVELQSKALAQLEQSRQQSMMDAALGYRSQAQGLEHSGIIGNIGAQNQALSNLSDIQRAGVTMNFQAQLEKQREELTRQLMSRHGGASTLQQVLGGLGAAGSIAAAPFTKGTSLMAMPGFLNMAIGPGGNSNSMAGAEGAAQFASSFFQPSQPTKTQSTNPYNQTHRTYAPGL